MKIGVTGATGFIGEYFGMISDTIFIDNAIEQWPALKVEHKGKKSIYGGG